MLKKLIFTAIEYTNRLLTPFSIYIEVGRMHTYPPNQTNPKDMPEAIRSLTLSNEAMFKLLKDFEFNTVLDVGSGAGNHAKLLSSFGKTVTALDFGKSVYFDSVDKHDYNLLIGDFFAMPVEKKFDCVWASHVLEHQPDPGMFIRKCIELLEDDGILAITVPPLKHPIAGGHLTLWNAGLLLYNLVFNGLDCRDAAIRSYGYNISVIVRKKMRGQVDLDYDNGDIDRLAPYFPPFCHEYFDGRIASANW
jgi:SAM-dependent methyltransferase